MEQSQLIGVVKNMIKFTEVCLLEIFSKSKNHRWTMKFKKEQLLNAQIKNCDGITCDIVSDDISLIPLHLRHHNNFVVPVV